MPRVSVVIPTYNRAQLLRRAVNSVLAQSYRDYEVLVVDDGSNDDTAEVVTKLGKRVRYFYKENGGASSARNLALAAADGEFIAYLDADDTWSPHKLETQIAFLDAHKEYALVHSDVAIVDETDRLIHARFNRETLRSVPQGCCIQDLLRDCHIQTLTVVERRKNAEQVGPFDERLKITHDYCRWIVAAHNGALFGYIDEPLAVYRRWEGGISNHQRAMWEDLAKMYEILLSEGPIADRRDQEALNIINEQLVILQRDLSYLDRMEGKTGDARRRILGLLWRRPFHPEFYLEFAKSCVPFPMARMLRTLKEKRQPVRKISGDAESF